MTECDVRHARDIGDRRPPKRQPIVTRQVCFKDRQNVLGVVASLRHIDLVTELVVQAGVTWAARNFVLGHHQPLRNARQRYRIGRQPCLASPLARHVDQNCLAIANDDVAILEDRKLPEWIELDQRTFLMRAGSGNRQGRSRPAP